MVKRIKAAYKALSAPIASILFLGFTLLVYAPLEMYFANQKEFWFSFGNIFVPVLIYFLLFIVLFIGIAFFLKGKWSQVYCGVIFGFGLAVYLQGNFFNQKISVLNGSEVDWSNYTSSFLINASFWAIFILGTIFFSIKKKELSKKVFLGVSLFLTAVQVAALIVLILTADLSFQTAGFLSRKDEFTLSKESNTIIFVLDMFDEYYMQELLEQDPTLADDLDGFTYFKNSTGGYATTKYSIPLLLTGERFKNETSFSNFLKDAYEDNPYYERLQEQEYNIEFYTSAVQSIDPAFMYALNNYSTGTTKISNQWDFAKTMSKFVLSKYGPNLLKPQVWLDGNEFDELKAVIQGTDLSSPYKMNNELFYQRLLSQGLSVSRNKPSFKVHHVKGAHYPFIMDENFQPKENATYMQAAQGSFKMVREYLSQMKALNIYDSANIVITADHGYYTPFVVTNPLMLIKPAGEKGVLNISQAPVCQDDLLSTLAGFLDINAPVGSGMSMFEVEETNRRDRLFYSYDLSSPHKNTNYDFYEYRFDSSRNDMELVRPSGYYYTSTGEYLPISRYHDYDIGSTITIEKSDEPSVYFDCGVDNNGFSINPYTQMSFTIKDRIESDLEVKILLNSHSAQEQRILFYGEDNQQLHADSVRAWNADKEIRFVIPKDQIKDAKLLLKVEYPDSVSARTLDKTYEMTSPCFEAVAYKSIVINEMKQ